MPVETNPRKLLVINQALPSHPTLKYLFKGSLKDSLHTEFGVAEITTAFTDATGYVFEPNSPKPPRASKRTSDPEIEGAYCSYTKTSALRGDRYTIQRAVNKLKLATTLMDAYYITLNGIKYAWRRPKLSAEQLAETSGYLTLLGIETISFSDKDLVWGATFPKPPKVKKSLADGSTITSFCDTTKVDDALAAGWSVVHEGLYTVDDLNNLLY